MEVPGDVAERGDPQTESAIQYNRAKSGVMPKSARGGEVGRFGGMFAANLVD